LCASNAIKKKRKKTISLLTRICLVDIFVLTYICDDC
jgi:hypothetical protein